MNRTVGLVLVMASYFSGLQAMAMQAGDTTALHQAAINTNANRIQALLKAGASSSMRDTNGCTPVHLAAHMGNVKCIKAFIDAGADLNLKDNEGNTPLDLVEFKKQVLQRESLQDAIDILVAAGARRGIEIK